MLKARISAEHYESADESVKSFYKAEGDDYILQVEGMTTKSKLDEFRNNNVELMKKLEAFKDVDVDKYKDMVQQLENDRMEKLSIEERLEVTKSDYEGKLENLQKSLDEAVSQIDTLKAEKDSTIKKYEIQGATQKAFVEHRIRPEAQEALTALINTKFTVKDSAVVAMENDEIVKGNNGNLTVSEFIASQDDFIKIPSQGGRGNGGGEGNVQHQRSTVDKISAGLKKLNQAS